MPEPSDDSDAPRPAAPSRRMLLGAGLVVAGLAGTVAAFGLVGRANTARNVAQWTERSSVPTVSLAAPQKGSADLRVVLPGDVQAFNKAQIFSRVSGYVHTWTVDIGAEVKAGQVLATIDTPDLDQQVAQAEANAANAEAAEQVAAVTAERWGALVGRQAVSQQAYDEKAGAAQSAKAVADAAKANVRQYQALVSFKELKAPFDGVVTARNVEVGALVNAGGGGGATALFEVSDLHRVRIFVQVPQAMTAGLEPGLKADFSLPQFPGKTFEATLTTTSRSMSATSRSLTVELQADNAAKLFAQGSYCQVHFRLASDPDTVRLPATALISKPPGSQVAVLGVDGAVSFKSVVLGHDFGDSVQILSGLSLSDKVIDNPPETLLAGAKVNVAASTPASPTPTPSR